MHGEYEDKYRCSLYIRHGYTHACRLGVKGHEFRSLAFWMRYNTNRQWLHLNFYNLTTRCFCSWNTVGQRAKSPMPVSNSNIEDIYFYFYREILLNFHLHCYTTWTGAAINSMGQGKWTKDFEIWSFHDQLKDIFYLKQIRNSCRRRLVVSWIGSNMLDYNIFDFSHHLYSFIGIIIILHISLVLVLRLQ